MTDKQIMTHYEKVILQSFKRQCAISSQKAYDLHKAGKRESGFNIMGNIYKLEAEYYASIHNCKKIESFSYLKQIKDLQNDILNNLLFDWETTSITCICNKTGKRVNGATEAVRQGGIVFKKAMKQLKCCMETALLLDDKFGYWK